jgi:hypothetical protein
MGVAASLPHHAHLPTSPNQEHPTGTRPLPMGALPSATLPTAAAAATDCIKLSDTLPSGKLLLLLLAPLNHSATPPGTSLLATRLSWASRSPGRSPGAGDAAQGPPPAAAEAPGV